ncbi:hypothetical protein CPB86DRAFT_819120 [Serendipita vermifera]|nr:hypothetical protein CPB86DRAFT_819120 [Serendipita vermifera]
MSDQKCSALSRIPTEIWWEVLERVISAPLYLATDLCDDPLTLIGGPNVIHKQNWDRDHFYLSLIVISQVCRSWREFVEARKCRSMDLCTSEIGQDSFDMNDLVKAERVDLIVDDEELPQCFVIQPMGWKILSGPESQAKHMARIQCTNLRRFILVDLSGQIESFDANSFLSSIGMFTTITWFEYHVYKYENNGPIPVEGERELVKLPHIKLLIWHTRFPVYFPFDYVILPSVQHFIAISMTKSPTHNVSMVLNMLKRCGRTLRSFYLLAEGGGDEVGEFPPWSEVPHLEQFQVKANFEFNFHLLPPEHPLKRITVQHWSIDNISSWLDSPNMQYIRLLTKYMRFETSLYGPSLATQSKEQEMDRLFAKAKENDVYLDVFISDDRCNPIGSRYATKRLF